MTVQESKPPRSRMRAGVMKALAICVVAALAACTRVIVLPRPTPGPTPPPVPQPVVPRPVPPPPPRPRPVESFSSADRRVGTYYFYWYKFPTSHFFDDAQRRDDALTDHFPVPQDVDYESVDWHGQQFSDMAWCGIDFVLPVYWGAPGLYDRGTGIFSVRGLDAMQRARDRLLAQGKPCPRIGMFYDTTTLLNSLRGDPPREGRADLTTPHGKDVFYGTIRDYFRRLDRRHWALLDGRPIIGLYSAAFAARFDESLFDYVYTSFERDFGVRPYVIAETSWGRAGVDAFYSWGAALSGPAFRDVAQIGPGYNDSAVPGRQTPIRDRENGRFYEWSWLEAIRSGRHIVLLETWNEMHEGTDICCSAEYEHKYMDLTRKYVQLFKSGKPVENRVVLQHPQPLPRRNPIEAREYANERQVWINFATGGNHGVRIVDQGDGHFELTEAHGRRCVRSTDAKATYLYFAVADGFYFDQNEPLTIEFDYVEAGEGPLVLEYDSRDPKAPLDGAYKAGGKVDRHGGEHRWRTATFRLNDARFCNRQNGGSDFRIAVIGSPTWISRVTVTKSNRK